MEIADPGPDQHPILQENSSTPSKPELRGALCKIPKASHCLQEQPARYVIECRFAICYDSTQPTEMQSITIWNVPDEVHRALGVRAAMSGRSTEAEIREILEQAARPEGRVKLGSLLAQRSAASTSKFTAIAHHHPQ